MTALEMRMHIDLRWFQHLAREKDASLCFLLHSGIFNFITQENIFKRVSLYNERMEFKSRTWNLAWKSICNFIAEKQCSRIVKHICGHSSSNIIPERNIKKIKIVTYPPFAQSSGTRYFFAFYGDIKYCFKHLFSNSARYSATVIS